MSEPVIDILCAPLRGGQAVLELNLRQRVLEEIDLYSRKRRLRHTFLVRDGDRIAKFEVAARVTLLPARISVPVLKELVVEAVEEEIVEIARTLAIERGVPEDDPDFAEAHRQMAQQCREAPNHESRVAHHTQRLIDSFAQSGVIIE